VTAGTFNEGLESVRRAVGRRPREEHVTDDHRYDSKQNADSSHTDAPARGKRPYRAPALVEYGSVAKLTKGTKSVNADGPGNTMKRKVCL
jgi:hypothetical protein